MESFGLLVNAKFSLHLQKVYLSKDQQLMLAGSSTMVEFDRCHFENAADAFIGRTLQSTSSRLQLSFKGGWFDDRCAKDNINELTRIAQAGRLAKLKINMQGTRDLSREDEEAFKDLFEAAMQAGCNFVFEEVKGALGTLALRKFVTGGAGTKSQTRVNVSSPVTCPVFLTVTMLSPPSPNYVSLKMLVTEQHAVGDGIEGRHGGTSAHRIF
jgi:hypothetical protein